MLIKRTKQLIGISILIICLLLFLIIGLLTKNVENEPEISPEKSYDITLKYIAQGNPRQTEEIPLTTSEQESLNNILDNMRFSDSAKSATNQKYIINYCDNELSLGENNIVSKNNKTVSISDGYEELIKFLDRQKDKLTLIYLYKKDVVSSEEIKEAQNIQISDLDKQKIKEIWEKQDKNIIENKEEIDAHDFIYTIILNEEKYDLEKNLKYIKNEKGYILLNETVTDILKNYTEKEKLGYSINNELSNTDSQFKERGIYYDTYNRPDAPHIFTIASGMKNSGGYAIKIDKVNIDNLGNIEVIVKEMSPNKENNVTASLIYPICQITFKTYPENIIFKTENNEILKNINT